MKINNFSLILLLSLFFQNMYTMSFFKDIKSFFQSHLTTDNNQENTQDIFFDAANNGNIKLVHLCLQSGADINAQNSSGWTALHCATREEDLKIVQYLINHNANVNAKDKNGWTALHIAAARGNQKIVEYLVNNSADITTNTKRDLSTLPAETIEWFKSTHANINAQNSHCLTALDLATLHGKDKITTLLKNYRKSAQEVMAEPTLFTLEKAIEEDSGYLARLLLQNGTIPTQRHLDLIQAYNAQTVSRVVKKYLRLTRVNFGTANHEQINLPQDVRDIIASYAI
jgi:ankyrin repeat protein